MSVPGGTGVCFGYGVTSLVSTAFLDLPLEGWMQICMLVVSALMALVGLSAFGMMLGPIVVRLDRESFLGTYTGQAWTWPFVFVAQKSRDPAEVERHETVHFYQACELLLLPCPVVYAALYLRGRWKHGSWSEAYVKHPMEIQAREVAAGAPQMPFGWKAYFNES